MSRFQGPQYPDDMASVSSQKTFPAYTSQSECLRNEIGEIAKSFSQITTQEIARIQDAIQAVQSDSCNPQLSQWRQSFEAALHQAHDSATVSMTRSLVQAEEQTQADFTSLKSTIDTGISTMTALMNALIQEKTEALKRLSTISRNIEARVKGHVKRQRKTKGGKLCACLLKAGKGMKKKEREAALASGALVCTCPA